MDDRVLYVFMYKKNDLCNYHQLDNGGGHTQCLDFLKRKEGRERERERERERDRLTLQANQ